MVNTYDHIFMVGDVLVSPDIINVKFCCDLDKCHGQCCIEGDAGAPVTLDETMEIENVLDTVWGRFVSFCTGCYDSRVLPIPMKRAI